MKTAYKVITLLIISIILYFGMIIAYEHPLGGITGYTYSDSGEASLIGGVLSFFVLAIIIISILVMVWRRHHTQDKKRKA